MFDYEKTVEAMTVFINKYNQCRDFDKCIYEYFAVLGELLPLFEGEGIPVYLPVSEDRTLLYSLDYDKDGTYIPVYFTEETARRVHDHVLCIQSVKLLQDDFIDRFDGIGFDRESSHGFLLFKSFYSFVIPPSGVSEDR